LEYPELWEDISKSLIDSDFSGEIKDVYIEMVRQYNSTRTLKEGWNFEGDKLASLSGKIALLSLYAEEKYREFSPESVKIEAERLIDRLKKNRRMHHRLQLEKELREAEKSGDVEKKKRLLEEFKVLLTS